jgi:acetyl-CoA carboxylase carboxyl transferase subunit alpha
MKITAYDLKQLNVIDRVIPEPKGGAHRDLDQQAAYLNEVIEMSIEELTNYSEEELLEKRWEKYKQIGEYRTVE